MVNVNFKKLDNVTKTLLILLVGVVFYFGVSLAFKPFFTAESTSMMERMQRMMGGSIPAFSNTATINSLSLIIAILVSLIASYQLFKQGSGRSAGHDNEYKIIRKTLSDDEKRILDEVKKAGKITQDSLRFRLGWSKAKVSTILTNLDRIGLIQRERVGKTYRVHLQG